MNKILYSNLSICILLVTVSILFPDFWQVLYLVLLISLVQIVLSIKLELRPYFVSILLFVFAFIWSLYFILAIWFLTVETQ